MRLILQCENVKFSCQEQEYGTPGFAHEEFVVADTSDASMVMGDGGTPTGKCVLFPSTTLSAAATLMTSWIVSRAAAVTTSRRHDATYCAGVTGVRRCS
jgi:hypothetical protein